jgi:hypothetical protein
MFLERIILFIFLLIGFIKASFFAQTTLADEIKIQLEDFPSSKKKMVINYIASFHKILEVEKNNRNDTIRVIALNTHRSFYHTDSIIIYNFTYTPYGNIKQIKIVDEKGKPAYFGIYDSDLHYSSIHFNYDELNREMGYDMYSDTLLTETQNITENPDKRTLTVSTFKLEYNTYNNKQIYTLDTFRLAVIKRNEDNQICSFEEKLYNTQFQGGKIKSYRFYKFDVVTGKVLEEPFSIFGNVDYGIHNYERIVYQYDAKGNLISWRKCDFNYALHQPELPLTKEEFSKRKEDLNKQNEENTKKAINIQYRNEVSNYYIYYETYEEYLDEDYLPYLEYWEDEIAIALFFYNKKGNKRIATRYLNYKGVIIYQEGY